MPFKKGQTPKGATPFKKGQTGNPNGRPKIPNIRDVLAEVLGEDVGGKNAAKSILLKMRSKAMQGDVKAAEFIFGYTYSKASQNIDLTTQGEKIESVIMWGDREIKI